MEQVALESQASPAKYHHVALWKFLLLSMATFGLYQLYWFYKSWKYVQSRDHSDIQPLWRALFAPIWFYSLAEDIAGEKTAQSASIVSGSLTILYLLLNASSRLPDPYWLITFLSAFVVIPLVRDVDTINRLAGVNGATYRRYSWKHIAVTAVGLPLLAFIVVSSTGILPNTQVMSGRQLPGHVVSMLKERGLLQEGEEVIYYYSTALFSYADDGNYFTENRVVSYWQEGGAFSAEQARYEEIEDIEVEHSNFYLDDTQVTIKRKDGTGFILLVSAEEEKDHQFVDSVKRLWTKSKEDT